MYLGLQCILCQEDFHTCAQGHQRVEHTVYTCRIFLKEKNNTVSPDVSRGFHPRLVRNVATVLYCGKILQNLANAWTTFPSHFEQHKVTTGNYLHTGTGKERNENLAFGRKERARHTRIWSRRGDTEN